MRIQNSKFKVQGSRFKKFILLLLCSVTALLIYFSLQPFAFASEKWAGVDESVVEKFAKEHGREAREPLINTDQGDLLLFVFLIAGAVGGFVAGYYWRILMEQRAKSKEQRYKERGDYA